MKRTYQPSKVRRARTHGFRARHRLYPALHANGGYGKEHRHNQGDARGKTVQSIRKIGAVYGCRRHEKQEGNVENTQFNLPV